MFIRPALYSDRPLDSAVDSWRARGGSANPATLRAMSNAMRYAREQGIFSKISRLNFFCGNNLTSCMIPLIANTTYGDASDTNVNFVAADFINSGRNGGLKGNGTTKYLRTGDTLAKHLAVGNNVMAIGAYLLAENSIASGEHYFMGSWTNTETLTVRRLRQFVGATNGQLGQLACQVSSPADPPYNGANNLRVGMYQMAQQSEGTASLWRNDTQIGSGVLSASMASSPFEIYVFAYNQNDSPQNYSPMRLGGYYIGIGAWSVAQVLAMNTLWQVFQRTLGRIP